MIIRTDIQVLSANDPEKDLVGWSIFENIGVAVFEE